MLCSHIQCIIELGLLIDRLEDIEIRITKAILIEYPA